MDYNFRYLNDEKEFVGSSHYRDVGSYAAGVKSLSQFQQEDILLNAVSRLKTTKLTEDEINQLQMDKHGKKRKINPHVQQHQIDEIKNKIARNLPSYVNILKITC